MNVFGYHYPAGAANDPSAPYNQRDAETCETCGGEGFVECPSCKGKPHDCEECDDEGVVVCEDCDQTGERQTPSREDIAIDKADRARDLEKDEPRD